MKIDRHIVFLTLLATCLFLGWLFFQERAKSLDYELHARVYQESLRLSESAVVITAATENSEALIVEWSRGAEELFGWTEGEVQGKKIDILIPEDMRELHRRAYQKAVDRGGMTGGAVMQVVKCRALGKNGLEFWVVMVVRYLSEEGEPPMFSALIEEVDDVIFLELEGG